MHINTPYPCASILFDNIPFFVAQVPGRVWAHAQGGFVFI